MMKVEERKEEIINLLMEQYNVSIDNVTPEMYKKAKILLENYRNIVWSMIERVEELEEECKEMLNANILIVIDILDRFNPRMNVKHMENRVLCLQEAKIMSKLIVVTAIKIKKYYKNGDILYKILEQKYLNEYQCSEDDIIENLNISKSTLYRYQKKAIKLFSYCLWNMVLPEVLRKNRIEDGRIMGGFVLESV